MGKSYIEISHSWWWLLLLVGVAIGFAVWRYAIKKKPWTKSQNIFLGVIHFLSVLCLLFLFLKPKIHEIAYKKIKPVLTLAIDNSASMLAKEDSAKLINGISQVEDLLKKEDVEVKMLTLNGLSENLPKNFKNEVTNLHQLLATSSTRNTSEHHVATVLFTDGIFNQGSSPFYFNTKKPIFTVGVGDTTQQKDVRISRVKHNKISFLGNKTQIAVEVSHSDFDNQQVSVQVWSKKKKLAQQTIKLTKKTLEVPFMLPMNTKGLNNIQLVVTKLQGESNLSNNRKNILIEVIKDQHKVQIIAAAPHPDIKAIRQALSQSPNYETSVYIPSMNQRIVQKQYDVVVLHNIYPSQLPFKLNGKTGVLCLVNASKPVYPLNQDFPFIRVNKTSSSSDKVSGAFNSSFRKFKAGNLSYFENSPPVEVPYGSYKTTGNVEVLMYQKLGSATTQKPLMVYNDNGSSKRAVWFGQGFWRWRMQEMAIEGSAKNFDDLVTKTVQYLSLKNDKKQFYFKNTKNIFSTYEQPSFEVSVYDENYERVFGDEISIEVIGNNGFFETYSFASTENLPLFKLGLLDEGNYSYTAKVQVGKKAFTDRGSFYVKKTDQEFQNLTADHQSLRLVAKKSKGQFFKLNQIDELQKLLQNKNYKPLLRSEEKDTPLNTKWWWYLIIFSLFSLEWFLRKYWGGY